jgi:pimeloyl-ACP methyl ester carboxylesterase
MPTLIIKSQFVRASDTLEVAYRRWGHERTGSLPIIAVHDDWATGASWTLLAGELTERWLLAPDLRGRGQTRADDHGYTIPELVDDLLGFLDGMGMTKVHLLGHGLGAAICAELALRSPARVASLTLVSLPWVDGMPERLVDRATIEAHKYDPRAFTKAHAALMPKAKRDMLWAGLIEAGHRQRLAAALGKLDALVAWAPGDRLGALGMPRRVVDGELDVKTGGEVAARAAQALGCPRVTLAGVGSLLLLEDPEALAEVVRKLLREAGG